MIVVWPERTTPEEVWRPWLAELDPPPLDWGAPGRVVVVVPHPDDESLALGGSLVALREAGFEVSFVLVTDGEAAYDPDDGSLDLALERRAELTAALHALGFADVAVHTLGLPDRHVSDHEAVLEEALVSHVEGAAVVLAPCPEDGHRDHAASGRAAAAAATLTGARLVAYPVWIWHWAQPGDERVPWSLARAVALHDGARAAKRAALGAYASQSGPGRILPPDVLEHFERPVEVLFDLLDGAGDAR